jgi:hypothetical protein
MTTTAAPTWVQFICTQNLQEINNFRADGADDCDRLAKVHKCGQEKDPDLIGNMMQAADVSTPVVTTKFDLINAYFNYTRADRN